MHPCLQLVCRSNPRTWSSSCSSSSSSSLFSPPQRVFFALVLLRSTRVLLKSLWGFCAGVCRNLVSWQRVLTECSERLDSNAACLGANVAGRILSRWNESITSVHVSRGSILRAWRHAAERFARMARRCSCMIRIERSCSECAVWRVRMKVFWSDTAPELAWSGGVESVVSQPQSMADSFYVRECS